LIVRIENLTVKGHTDSDRAVSREEDNSTQYPIVKTQYPIPNSNSQFPITQYPIPNSNSENPIAIAIAIVKKPNSIAIAIGYWVLVLHVYFKGMHADRESLYT
jgi:hypothetical protein